MLHLPTVIFIMAIGAWYFIFKKVSRRKLPMKNINDVNNAFAALVAKYNELADKHNGLLEYSTKQAETMEKLQQNISKLTKIIEKGLEE